MLPDRWTEMIEAAAKLRVPYHTCYRWVLTGRLKGERRDGHWFVEAEDLVRLLAERRNRSATAAIPRAGQPADSEASEDDAAE